MDLVAREYITAQVESDGVLVLSDQAGIHDQLGEHTVTVTPCDTQGFAEAIAGALSMSRAERRRRMTRLRRWVSDHDLEAWVSSNLHAARGDRTIDPRSLSTSGAGGASRR
jgi:trehalose 6-phosphate synthase